MLYFFHLQRDGAETLDDTGTELPSVYEARREALRALCGLAADDVEGLRAGSAISLRIATGAGQQLGVLSLSFDEVPPNWAAIPPR